MEDLLVGYKCLSWNWPYVAFYARDTCENPSWKFSPRTTSHKRLSNKSCLWSSNILRSSIWSSRIYQSLVSSMLFCRCGHSNSTYNCVPNQFIQITQLLSFIITNAYLLIFISLPCVMYISRVKCNAPKRLDSSQAQEHVWYHPKPSQLHQTSLFLGYQFQ